VNIGCVITHEGFIYAMYGIASALDILGKPERARALNYMPLAHMFGCATIICVTYIGIVAFKY
jgi:long-subunit acyl-CoA synthetase (AMP-forming)